MVYGKVNEHEVPMNPKAGWYFVQIDTGIKDCYNPHRKGTKVAARYEAKWLKRNPVEKRTVETKARLYKSSVTGEFYWADNRLLTCYGGYKIKVIGARRMPESVQKVF